MTTAEQFDRMADQIIRQALADVRREAAQRTLAHHVRRVCDDAAEARRLVLLRREWQRRGDR